MKSPFSPPATREITLDIKPPKLVETSGFAHFFALFSGRMWGAGGTSQLLLLFLAWLFVVLGAVTLHLALRSAPWRLVAVVGGWTLAWGASFGILRRRLPDADPLILPVVALLTGWGLLLQARLAPAFMLRQTLWLLIGCGALCGVALYPRLPRLLRRYRYICLVTGLLLLGATLILGVNPSGYGQRLWLGMLGVYFQPSELLKLLLVIYLASYLCDRREATAQKALHHPLWGVILGPMLAMVGVALLLLGWQQDLGAALLFYLTFVAMLYLAWGKAWHVALSLIVFAPVALAGYFISDRVALRVSIWLDPWAPAQADRAFQILQSLFALASGGIFGQGLGQGFPTLIPVVHSDFVYAALVEEFGIVGAVGLLALLGLLVYRGILWAQRAESPFEALLAGGIAALWGIQTWVIVGGNAKLIPITGVTLPFVSYGGSSLLVMLMATGLLLNLSAPHPAALAISLAPERSPALRRTAARLGQTLLLLLALVALDTGFWAVLRSDDLRTYLANPRYILAESRIRRGRILDRSGVTLADSLVDKAGYVTRAYPVPEAAPVVGYATLQYGAAGLEAVCDARLRGAVARSPWDRAVERLLHQDPVGEDVRLTLDVRLQQRAQQLLTGYQGAVVVVDVRTGEILALASSPVYTSATVAEDWAALRENPAAPLLNRATQGLAQPGAILETVLLGTALQYGDLPSPTAPFTQTVLFNGSALTCGQPPTDDDWAAALAAACPAPFGALGQDLGLAVLAESFTAWGLTEPPALELPTVAAPWEPQTADVVREALGQGELLVTPLQMVGVAAALGNDGVRPALHLLTRATPGCVMPADRVAAPLLTPTQAASLRALWPRFGATVIGHVGQSLAGPERVQTWFIGLDAATAARYAVAVVVENGHDPQATARIGATLLEQGVTP
ncbi:MAG TPA: FtsW/RodA/SpoVE family cell cycle protein [Anaerolineae bacterium]|nr:FtsW/RodA/SpoVE family cell cycle protein [Anaerolineae bacterium]